MYNVKYLLEAAQVYLENGCPLFGRYALQDALAVAQAMRPTRKVRIMRAYIAQAIQALP